MTFQVILPSYGGNQLHKNNNRPGKFTITFEPPIDLKEDEYEVGLSEMVYTSVSKESSQLLKLPFTFYKIVGEAGNPNDPLYRGEESPFPYDFGRSPNFTIKGYEYQIENKIFIHIPSGAEGIDNMQNILESKFPWAGKFIKFIPGTHYTSVEIYPQRDIQRPHMYHMLLPDLDEEGNWGDLYHDIGSSKDFRSWLYILNHSQPLYAKIQERDNVNHVIDPYMENDDELDSNIKWDGMFNIEDSERTDPPLRKKELELIRKQYDLPHSLISEGAVFLDDYHVKSIVHGETHLLSEENIDTKKILIKNDITNSVPSPIPRHEFQSWLPGNPIMSVVPAAFYFLLRKKYYDIRDAASSFLVMCDIVETSAIANRKARILRCIPYNSHGSNGLQSLQYDPIFYKRVDCRVIHSITIMLANTLGQEVQFPNNSEVIVHLEFRKRNG